MPLTNKSEAQVLRRLSTLKLATEDDVKRFWIPELLGVLGYQFPENIQNEPSLPYLFESQGRSKTRLVRPDFLVTSHGIKCFVVEAKTPNVALSAEDLQQARSYAVHSEVRTPVFLLTNGTESLVMDSDSGVRLLGFSQVDLADSGIQSKLFFLLARELMQLKIGPLVLGDPIDSGAFGTVFRGRNIWLARDEAVKVLHFADDDAARRRQRFLRGSRAVARLEHPSIVAIHSLLPFRDTLVVSMDLIDGKPLDAWMKGKPNLEQRLEVFRQIVGAIAFAHSKGVLHRDLSPRNVLVEEVAGKVRARVVDFDTATLVGDAAFTATAESMGTVGFIAPERSLPGRKAADSRRPSVDTYSLGAIFFFLLTGRPPLNGAPLRDLEASIYRLRIPDAVRRWAYILLAKSLDRSPEFRYSTATELEEDLAAFMAGAEVPSGKLRELAREMTYCLRRMLGDDLWFSRFNFKIHNKWGQFGVLAKIPAFGELMALQDSDYNGMLVGYSFGTKEWRDFKRSTLPSRMIEGCKAPLKLYPPNSLEEGGLNAFIPSSQLLRSGADQTARSIFAILDKLESIRRAYSGEIVAT